MFEQRKVFFYWYTGTHAFIVYTFAFVKLNTTKRTKKYLFPAWSNSVWTSFSCFQVLGFSPAKANKSIHNSKEILLPIYFLFCSIIFSITCMYACFLDLLFNRFDHFLKLEDESIFVDWLLLYLFLDFYRIIGKCETVCAKKQNFKPIQ